MPTPHLPLPPFHSSTPAPVFDTLPSLPLSTWLLHGTLTARPEYLEQEIQLQRCFYLPRMLWPEKARWRRLDWAARIHCVCVLYSHERRTNRQAMGSHSPFWLHLRKHQSCATIFMIGTKQAPSWHPFMAGTWGGPPSPPLDALMSSSCMLLHLLCSPLQIQGGTAASPLPGKG